MLSNRVSGCQNFEYENPQEEKDAYRQFQEEVAVASMKNFMNRQRESRRDYLAKSKKDLRAVNKAQSVFEDSLRKNEARMDRLAAPRTETKKRRIDLYVKETLPIDSTQTGKAYTDALKLTSAIYFSACELGTLLPQTKKKVSALTKTTVGPASNGKRQIKAYQVISTLQESYGKFQRWRPAGVTSADLLAVLDRFKLGAHDGQMERLVREFGIQRDDALEMDDFVETGVAIFTIVAPDVLVMDLDNPRRSKSAEPTHFGKKSLVDLERACVSSLGIAQSSGISFTRSEGIKDDLALHLAGAVKSTKAREREMLMLAQEAMDIKKLRENRPAKVVGGGDAAAVAAEKRTDTDMSATVTPATPAPKSGGFNFGKKSALAKKGPLSSKQGPLSSLPLADVAFADAPEPSDRFMMGPSPAPGQMASGTQPENHEPRRENHNALRSATPAGASDASHQTHPITSTMTSKKGPLSFKKSVGSCAFKPGAISSEVSASSGAAAGLTALDPAGLGREPTGMPNNALGRPKAVEESGVSNCFLKVEALLQPVTVAVHQRPTTSGSASRPGTRQGSRPSSRQTPYREDDVIPTQLLHGSDASHVTPSSSPSGGTTVGFKFKSGAATKMWQDHEAAPVGAHASLPHVREGLNPLPVAAVPAAPPVDTTGLSRVQRMKLLQQQHATSATGQAAESLPVATPPAPLLPQANLYVNAPEEKSVPTVIVAVPVPGAEPLLFSQRPRGNRPF